MTATALPRTASRAALAHHAAWTYGILAIEDHAARTRLLLAVRRSVQEALDLLDEDVDCSLSEWKDEPVKPPVTLAAIERETGLARSTVQDSVSRGKRIREAENAATGPARHQRAGAAAAQTE